MRRTRAFMVMLAVVLLAGSTAASASAAGWEKISRDRLANTAEATTVVAGSSIITAWSFASGPGTQSIEAVTFSTSVTDAVQNPVTVPVVSDWTNLNLDPELVTAPDGGIVMAFAGTHTTDNADPLNGIAFSSRAATGAWNPPVNVIPGASANYGLGALLLNDGSSLVTGDCCGIAASIFHGATNLGDAAAGLSQTSVQNRTIGRDGAGNVWAAWYDGGDHGFAMRQLDPVSGVPLGVPVAAPDSNAVWNNGSRAPLVCNPTGAGCRLVYRSEDRTRVVTWAPGEPAPTTVATGPAQSTLGATHAAYRADGRLWVAWVVIAGLGDPYVQFTLGDGRGAGAAIYPLSLQKLDSPYHLRLEAVGQNVLMVGNFGAADGDSGSAQWANLVGIPSATVDNTGPKDVAVETGPTKGTFRIQVQFRAPSQCGASCKAHAEIRNRTGVCPASCLASGARKLPGDGAVVIGTRGTFTAPGTRKIRFYLTVTKAALLRTPFHTQGGFRVGDTRLRVYITTKAGTVLAVRDGHIKVSIARIRSGALPGLTGIL